MYRQGFFGNKFVDYIDRLELYTKIEHSRDKESIGAKQCPAQWLVDYVMICMIASFIKNEKNQQ